jgi:hypothetical protein
MGEMRRQRKERLQAAGVWADFLGPRGQLVSEGLTPAQADDEAMRRVEALPPRRPEKPPAMSSGGDIAVENPVQVGTEAGGLPDFGGNVPNSEAVQWVAENLVNPAVRPQDAPGAQAWGLHQWVRSSPANHNVFWGSIWPKLAPKEDDSGQEWDGRGPYPTCGHEHATKEQQEQYDHQMEHLMAKEWQEVLEALKIVRGRKEQGLPPLVPEGVPGDEIPEGGPGEWR